MRRDLGLGDDKPDIIILYITETAPHAKTQQCPRRPNQKTTMEVRKDNTPLTEYPFDINGGSYGSVAKKLER
jgi:hypothetical protein